MSLVLGLGLGFDSEIGFVFGYELDLDFSVRVGIRFGFECDFLFEFKIWVCTMTG